MHVSHTRKEPSQVRLLTLTAHHTHTLTHITHIPQLEAAYEQGQVRLWVPQATNVCQRPATHTRGYNQ